MEAGVLIVHRGAAVRRFIDVSLGLLGCKTTTAPDAEEALRLMGTRHFDLLLTESDLPGMSGPDLVAAAQEAEPGIRTVLMSAYGRPPRGREDRFLAEPFGLDQLLEAVAPLLEEAASARPGPEHPAWLPGRAQLRSG